MELLIVSRISKVDYKEQHLFKSSVNAFSVTFDHFNLTLLNKSIRDPGAQKQS